MFVVLKWVQDWQFGLKLEASILNDDDMSVSGTEQTCYKDQKNVSDKKNYFWHMLLCQKITFGPIWDLGDHEFGDQSGSFGTPFGVGPNPVHMGPMEAEGRINGGLGAKHPEKNKK